MKQHYRGLGHIAVYTADMDASIAFYEKIGGSLRSRSPVCLPEQERELALVEFGGFLVELIAAPLPEEREGCIPTSPCMWMMWIRPPQISAPPASTPSAPRPSVSCPTPSADSRTGFSPVPPVSRSSCCGCSECSLPEDQTARGEIPAGRFL